MTKIGLIRNLRIFIFYDPLIYKEYGYNLRMHSTIKHYKYITTNLLHYHFFEKLIKPLP